jgi:large subunit ribosomal protein L30
MPEKKSPRTRAPKVGAQKSGGKITVKQVRSGIGRQPGHRRTLKALGLRYHQQTIEVTDSPSVRGMLFQVRHLVEVTEK